MRKFIATIALSGAVLGAAMAGGPISAGAAGAGLSGATVVQTALKYVGYPFKMKGQTPDSGFSDIGFVAFVLRQNGLHVPASRGKLLKMGAPVEMADLQPGDVLFFQNTIQAGLSHVGIYIGDGKFIQSEWYGYGVRVTDLHNDPRDGTYWAGHFLDARRITSNT